VDDEWPQKGAWPRSRDVILKQWDRYPRSTERISCSRKQRDGNIIIWFNFASTWHRAVGQKIWGLSPQAPDTRRLWWSGSVLTKSLVLHLVIKPRFFCDVAYIISAHFRHADHRWLVSVGACALWHSDSIDERTIDLSEFTIRYSVHHQHSDKEKAARRR